MALTAEEKRLAAEIGFDEDVLALVKEEIPPAAIERMTAYDDEGDEEGPADAIVVSVPREDSERLTLSLREKLRPKGYLAFRVESTFDFEDKADRIAVLQTTDDREILRLMQTNGINYGLEVDDVVVKFQEWQGRFDHEIFGAEFDSVEVLLHTLPADMLAFARELYAFCPDTLDQGYLVMVEEGFEGLPEERQEQIEVIQAEEPEGDDQMERVALRVMAADIHEARRFALWWD